MSRPADAKQATVLWPYLPNLQMMATHGSQIPFSKEKHCCAAACSLLTEMLAFHKQILRQAAHAASSQARQRQPSWQQLSICGLS